MSEHIKRVVYLLVVILFSVGGVRAADISSGSPYTTDTTLSDGDTWTTGSVTINSAVVVDIPAAATVTFDQGANATMNGDGTFRVQVGGAFVHDGPNSGADNIQLQGNITFDNLGTFEFARGGDVNLASTAQFINTGLLWKSGSNGTAGDPSYIFGSGTDVFMNTGTIQVDTGILNISRGVSTGGTFDVNAGRLEFEGVWTELTGVADIAGGVITFGDDDPAGTTGGRFIAGSATTVVNVSGDGIDWFGTGLDTNGNVISQEGILHLRATTATRDLTGGGTFLNASTGQIDWSQGDINVAASTTFSNEGTLEVQSGDVKTISGTGVFENAAGGVTNVNSGTAITANNTFVNHGTVNAVDGSVRFEGASGFHNDTDGTLNLQNGVTLTIDDSDLINDGVITYADDGTKTLAGNAALVNNGSFLHSQSGGNDNLQGSGTGGLINNGLFEFTGDGDFDVSSSNYTITNKGTFKRSGGSGDATFVFRNGNFINDSGGVVEATNGKIVIALNNSVSDAGSTWTANGGHIQIGGSWTGVFNGSASGSSLIFVGNNGNGTVGKNDLVVGAAGVTVNISGNGFELRAEDIDTAGNTFTNAGIFSFTTSAAKSVRGGGIFQNTGAGQMNLITTVLTLDATDLTNAATFTIAGTVSLDGTGELINAAGGTLIWDTPTTDSTFTLDAAVRNQATLNLTGGFNHILGGTGTFENTATGTINWNGAGNLTLNNDLTNNGAFNYNENATNLSLSGSASFINNGAFNHNNTGGGDNLDMNLAGGFINNGLYDFTHNGDVQLLAGFTLTNYGTVRKSAGEGNESLFFKFGAGNGSATGGTFDNQGIVEVLDGELRFSPDTPGQFDRVIIAQLSGATLTGGTWIVDATADGGADLDMAVATAGILTIGTDAKVKLIAAGSTFAQINNVTTVDGSFYVNGSRSFSLAAGFTVSATGILGGDGTFVGDADIAGILAPGDEGAAGILNFQSVVDMTGGTFQIDLNGTTVGSEYDQLAFTGAGPHTLTLSNTALDLALNFQPSLGDSFVIVDGFDTQTGIFNGLADGSSFDVDGNIFRIDYNPDNITLTVTFAVPEPATFTLLAVGSLGLLRRRRRN